MSSDTFNALLMLAHTVTGAQVIELQEAQGLRAAVSAQKLPSDIANREQWEALGFVFGEPFADDPVFLPATLPQGWELRASEEDHRSCNIVDPAGSVRGRYFYKAAFYDRYASMGPPARRYKVSLQYDRMSDETYQMCATRVVDGVTGAYMFLSKDYPTPSAWDYARKEAARNVAFDESQAWLGARFPDHADPGAYWPAS